MRHLIPVIVCSTLCLTSIVARQAPQTGQPQVTFKAEVNYVDVDTVVTDEQGNLIGKPQSGRL